MSYVKRIFIACCLSIIATASFTFAAEGTYVDNGADFLRVLQALEEDHVSEKFQIGFKHKQKIASLVCPSGQAEEAISSIPFSERYSIKINAAGFDLHILKKHTTVFLGCKEQEGIVWHKYVLSSCKKTDKGCISDAITMLKDSAVREPVVTKEDGRLYAKVSVSDVNLLFCPERKPAKIIGLTQRDSLLFQVSTMAGKDGFGLIFFSKTKKDSPGGRYHPLEYAYLKFDVQCGEDPVKELWVEPVQIPGRMIELK